MPPDSSSVLPPSYSGSGLVDLQVNGYAGFDFHSDPAGWTLKALQALSRTLDRRGVAVALPTLITDAGEALLARARTYRKYVERDRRLLARFPLLHIEGPFISPEDGPRGAHPQRFCRTPEEAPDLLAQLREASGDRIGILTLAPELPGALGLIEEATEAGICVGLGHTQASAGALTEAVDAGAVMSTHLGNGSHQTLPRLDNYVQVQLAEDRLWASFIADGQHMPFYTLKNFIRAKTPRRSVLVTDAILAAELGPGRYRSGHAEIEVTRELRVSKPGEPNLAGSALTMDRAVVNAALHGGVDFETAWAMASVQPADLLGLQTPDPVTVTDITEDGFTREPRGAHRNLTA